MVSTVQVPPPPPPIMPPRQPRSFAGPVVLIVLGVFFLLRSLGMIPWYNWGKMFAHYWPLLLILWGVVKLIEYQQANRAGMRPRGIGAGGFVLIIFLVIAGLSSTEYYRWNPNWQGWCDSSDAENLPWCGHTYSFSDDLQQPFPAGSSLHVNSERGAVNITTSDDNQIHVSVHKRVRGDREDQADKWNKSTRPQLTQSGTLLTLNANTQGAGDHWVASDLDISVPRKAAVAVVTHHGNVSIIGRDGSADVDSRDGGDVSITDINGAVTLNLDHTSARVAQVSSDVTVQGRANDVSLEDIKGNVRLEGDFMESVKLSRIAKAVNFKTSRTDMDFTRLDGNLNLDSGDLEANTVSGPIRLRTRSKDITLNGVTGDLRLQNENGTVEIHVNKVGNMEIMNSKGDIRVYVPQKSGFQLEAEARDGEIQSDFDSLKIQNSDDRSTATGSVNGGGARMSFKNEHGNIEIRSGVPMPPPPPGAPKMPHGGETPTPPESSEN